MFIEVPLACDGVTLTRPISLTLGFWDSGATTSMSGFQGLDSIRYSHLTSGKKASAEIDSAPEPDQLYSLFVEKRIRAILVFCQCLSPLLSGSVCA